MVHTAIEPTNDEESVSPPAEAAVAEVADMRVRQGERRLPGVQNGEVVAGSLHLGGSQRGWGIEHAMIVAATGRARTAEER
jgi:hypothetical protein